jgi:hypothetical protein
LDPVPLSKMGTHLLASLGSKGKNRNSLACLRNAGSHSAESYCKSQLPGGTQQQCQLLLCEQPKTTTNFACSIFTCSFPSAHFAGIEHDSVVLVSVAMQRCQACGNTPARVMFCARCKKAYCCNKACQKQHWPSHKAECKKHACAGAHEQAKDVPVAGSALACPHGATNKTRCFPRAEIYEPGKAVLTFEGLEVAGFSTVMQQVSTS